MRQIEFNGVTRPVADWARLTGIASDTLTKRLNAGWSVEAALTEPVGKQGRKAMLVPASSLIQALPALVDWQRDMHAAHRQLTRSIRTFVRGVEEQMAELRHGLDQHLAAQRDEAHRNIVAAQTTPGVVKNISKKPDDRCSPVAQETV
jgi:hypothetical protein